jgi:hypothetical protein
MRTRKPGGFICLCLAVLLAMFMGGSSPAAALQRSASTQALATSATGSTPTATWYPRSIGAGLTDRPRSHPICASNVGSPY